MYCINIERFSFSKKYFKERKLKIKYYFVVLRNPEYKISICEHGGDGTAPPPSTTQQLPPTAAVPSSYHSNHRKPNQIWPSPRSLRHEPLCSKSSRGWDTFPVFTCEWWVWVALPYRDWRRDG